MSTLSPKAIILPADTIMTPKEARKCYRNIKHSLGNVRLMVSEMDMYKGYKALGHSNFRQFAKARFPQRESWLYRERAAAKVEYELDLPIGEIDEYVLRPLTQRKLTVNNKKIAWNAANRVLKKKDSKRKYPTAKLLTRALVHYGFVNEKKPRELTPAAIVKKATSNFSLLNSEETFREVLGVLSSKYKDFRRNSRRAAS